MAPTSWAVLATLLLSMRGAQAHEQSRWVLPEGTYALQFCYPTCDDSSLVVGTGTFVHVHEDIRRRMNPRVVQSLGKNNSIMLLRDTMPPNACFRVAARRSVAGEEYYVGIIPASLTVVKSVPHDSVQFLIYASPDASFIAVVAAHTAGAFAGVGRQETWDGSRAPVTRISGRRTGPADPRKCVL